MPLAPLNDSLQAELNRGIKEFHLGPYAERLRAVAESCLQFTSVPLSETGAPGSSRLGGTPDLPESAEWPEGMAFLLQLNLAELPDSDVRKFLPEKGLLQFYVGDDEGRDAVPHRLELHAETDRWRTAEAPPEYVSVDDPDFDGSDPRVVYHPRGVFVQPRVSLPHFRSVEFESIWEGEVEDSEAYFRLQDFLHLQRPLRRLGLSQILGYPSVGEEDPALTATRHTGRPEAVEADDWILLLELDSDYDVGFCFWDAGKLQFLIRQADLSAGRFDRTYAGLIDT